MTSYEQLEPIFKELDIICKKLEIDGAFIFAFNDGRVGLMHCNTQLKRLNLERNILIHIHSNFQTNDIHRGSKSAARKFDDNL